MVYLVVVVPAAVVLPDVVLVVVTGKGRGVVTGRGRSGS